MDSIFRRRVPQAVVIVGMVLTLAWNGLIAWLSLSALVTAVLSYAGLART